MRIAFYAPLKAPDHPVPSGDRRVAGLLLEALRRGGHEIVPAPRFRSYDAGDPARQIRIERVGRRLASRWIARNRAAPPDLWFTYHLYHKAPDWLGPAASAALGIPYVVAEASYAPKQEAGPWDRGHRAVADALGMTRLAICLNPDDQACIEPLLPAGAHTAELPPFLDTAPARAAAGRRDEIRRQLAAELSLNAGIPWIATAAMMRPGDKLDSYRVLGAALERLSRKPWHLLVAGDGAVRPEVEGMLDFGGRVRFLGALDRGALDRLHAAADLAVWPAVNEAFGMALLEAQATGLPVVAGNRAGVAQIVRHGRTGLLASERNSAEFADAVAALLDDPAGRDRMRREALTVTRREHDIGVAAQRLGALLAGVPTNRAEAAS
jgi:glycosyltransferase involved in cell wall biosynthesis